MIRVKAQPGLRHPSTPEIVDETILSWSEQVSEKPVAIITMGVSGSGKTTVGKPLAERLGFEFRDGDEFHPPQNVAKMRSGTPLDISSRPRTSRRSVGLGLTHGSTRRAETTASTPIGTFT